MGRLQPYTAYRCSGCGLTTAWTGAYISRRPHDDQCLSCGSTMVAEGHSGRRWRVRFEYVNPLAYPAAYDAAGQVRIGAASVSEAAWRMLAKEHHSEASAREQFEGLLSLAAAGELVRNAVLESAPDAEACWSWEAGHIPGIAQE